jgi:hypothetical protein
MLRVGYVYYPESAEIETGATRSNINSYSLVLPDIEEEIEREVKRFALGKPGPARIRAEYLIRKPTYLSIKKQKTD